MTLIAGAFGCPTTSPDHCLRAAAYVVTANPSCRRARRAFRRAARRRAARARRVCHRRPSRSRVAASRCCAGSRPRASTSSRSASRSPIRWPTVRSSSAARRSRIEHGITLRAHARADRRGEAVACRSCSSRISIRSWPAAPTCCIARREAGVSGVLVTDMPVGSDPEREAWFGASGLDFVRLVAPTTPVGAHGRDRPTRRRLRLPDFAPRRHRRAGHAGRRPAGVGRATARGDRRCRSASASASPRRSRRAPPRRSRDGVIVGSAHRARGRGVGRGRCRARRFVAAAMDAEPRDGGVRAALHAGMRRRSCRAGRWRREAAWAHCAGHGAARRLERRARRSTPRTRRRGMTRVGGTTPCAMPTRCCCVT